METSRDNLFTQFLYWSTTTAAITNWKNKKKHIVLNIHVCLHHPREQCYNKSLMKSGVNFNFTIYQKELSIQLKEIALCQMRKGQNKD